MDAFRYKHPTTVSYTCKRLNTASRLDTIYTSKFLTKYITSYTHTHTFTILRPHSMSDNLSHLNTTKIHPNETLKTQQLITPKTRLRRKLQNLFDIVERKPIIRYRPPPVVEKTKLKIKAEPILLGNIIKKNMTDEQKHLQHQLQTLNPNNNTSEIHALQQEQKRIQNIQIRGAMMRSRFKYWPEDETPPESFIHDEKQKQNRQIKQFDTAMNTHIIKYFTKIWTTLSPTTHTQAFLLNIKRLNDTEVYNDVSPYITQSEVQNTIKAFSKQNITRLRWNPN